MGILDYFKPVSTWSADRVRKFLDQNSPQEYNLVDVRTPKEYETEMAPSLEPELSTEETPFPSQTVLYYVVLL